ncbi:hypothetical protein NCAS_0F01780 [Naumovozyma castellii]|uniref:FUN14 n=1 Tax=Naumovozyma castellii TaxID=27288 RepID=G0VGP1_NAUCA|nr:hypothetical protein NCAS_0F01780 [Naumovozyma castellii CBS 4309]CCC70662.1 hypothetical protein NCAS_0F01780 [Naumovozyma castellii CBS 4309]
MFASKLSFVNLSRLGINRLALPAARSSSRIGYIKAPSSFTVKALFGAGMLTGGLWSIPKLTSTTHLIHNDAPLVEDEITIQPPVVKKQPQYRQLCLGSLFGIVAGIIVGKLSSILIGVGLLSLISVRWLMRGNILVINKEIMTKDGFLKMLNIDSSRMANLTDNRFFKGSFLLTFILTVVNI